MAGPMVGGRARLTGAPGKKIDKKTLLRLCRYLKPYTGRLVLVFFFIIISALVSVGSAKFMQLLIDDYITPLLTVENPVFDGLLKFVITMACIYVVGLVSSLCYVRLMATIAHGALRNIRDEMFSHMQSLPVKYFDTNTYGDVMSHYTNDADTLTQLISQTIPNFLSSMITIISVFCAMLWSSVWLTLLVIVCMICTLLISGKVASKSGKYFIGQQRSIGDVNGYIEEMIGGQKVIKVFCHEEKANEIFNRKNGELFANASSANSFANILMPMMNALGQVLYVLVAAVGGILLITGATNVGLSGIGVITSGIIVSFLMYAKNFSRPISQMSQQINTIAMALAGAQRIFDLIDERSEDDEGYVTLVHAVRGENGELSESETRTGLWAWKHPHEDGTVTYTELKGDIRFYNVDFAYEEGKDVLHDITLYAEPGQKVAFVGATGAGKTTITNLINRFYDIADGKIRYDGININKIRKDDLRRSLGVVLQDVNLFTGTVMENIRYGKLDASDEECIAAAKRVNADGFIRMLPKGYDTLLSGDGAGLSQGQRQLISIARAAVADPPVMILDEATSSIDTHTESIVQKGMDALMSGRTVFVIAHRLSTVRNSDVIMVLDHGKIIERGDHEKLLSEHGTYWQLYTGAFELE